MRSVIAAHAPYLEIAVLTLVANARYYIDTQYAP